MYGHELTYGLLETLVRLVAAVTQDALHMLMYNIRTSLAAPKRRTWIHQSWRNSRLAYPTCGVTAHDCDIPRRSRETRHCSPVDQPSKPFSTAIATWPRALALSNAAERRLTLTQSSLSGPANRPNPQRAEKRSLAMSTSGSKTAISSSSLEPQPFVSIGVPLSRSQLYLRICSTPAPWTRARLATTAPSSASRTIRRT